MRRPYDPPETGLPLQPARDARPAALSTPNLMMSGTDSSLAPCSAWTSVAMNPSPCTGIGFSHRREQFNPFGDQGATAMLWIVLKEAAGNWSRHKDARQGAALAYYSVFSLGPIIVIAIAIAGFFFGQEAVSGQVESSIKDMLGDTGAKAVQAMLADAGRPREGLVATLLGVGAMIFAAIGVVVQLKDALNIVWEVEETPGQGIWQFVRNYVVSLAAVLAVGFLLLVSLLVTAGLAVFGQHAAPHVQQWLLHLVTLLASLGIISLLFAMMFKWLPDAAVDWYDVWLGAVITALLFELGKSAIGFYIGKQGLESVYGAAASIIVVLIWVYYSSQIILMGAEVTHAFAKHKGSIRNIERSGRSPERLKDVGSVNA